MGRVPSAVVRAIRAKPGAAAAAVAGAALAAAAVFNKLAGDRAERRQPPGGSFVTVDGVDIHYLEAGSGSPVLLLHGNGAMAEDFVISGLFERLAKTHRVIAPDRPGFGYSERPRHRLWTPTAQARLISGFLNELGIENPIVLGHSWGSLVAVAMALETDTSPRGLVLLSGYYYPTPRVDVVAFSGPAVPVVGDVMRYTVSPPLGRAIAPALFKRIFAPRPVPARFKARFPTDLALRPWQIRASAEDTALMVPAAAGLQKRYGALDLPVTIIAGAGDLIATTATHSERLHREVAQSRLIVVPGIGHMVHYSATGRIKDAVDLLA